MRNEFEANTDAWISYGNWLIDEFDDVQPAGTVTVQVDILQTKRLDDDDRVETVLEAEFDENQHEYTDLSWTVDEPDDPDYTIAIRNSAALNASDDLLEYRRSYIDESGDADNHELPDEEYVSTLAGKYAPGLIFGEEEHSVLELLVGDITGE
ncbi:hypothetical protein BB347_17715 (plasmid) [Natronorubrum daqingense]|uniref:Uncharacterized protein n=1 Tax=Natronorubrum daqingense TaxID=588898 RepID=A0A1P8RJ97_9EURY|nr:hypothetical protein BB347_17715 [Natronorubrum daqingense]